MVRKTQDEQEPQQDVAAVSQWKFEIGQSVRRANGEETAEVVWRRESQSEVRDYLVKSEGGTEVWLAESELEAA